MNNFSDCSRNLNNTIASAINRKSFIFSSLDACIRRGKRTYEEKNPNYYCTENKQYSIDILYAVMQKKEHDMKCTHTRGCRELRHDDMKMVLS